MTSITNLLRQEACDHSPAFYIPPSKGDTVAATTNGQNYGIISYKEFWNTVDRHIEWLLEKIHLVISTATSIHGNQSKDVVIAYLSDNSTNLLANVLSCIDLTQINFLDATSGIIPAMMNVRWTPLEIARVLSPKQNSNEDNIEMNILTSFVTILLYGDGYEKTAVDAVNFVMADKGKNDGNLVRKHHYAIALPLPNFSSEMKSPIKNKDIYKFSNKSASKKDAILLFTSGTSSALGIPKGVRLSHSSLYVQALAKTKSPCSYDRETVVAGNTVPLFHVGGLSSLLAVLLGGGCVVFHHHNAQTGSRNKGFQPDMVLKSLKTQHENETFSGVNTLVVVPAMLHAIFEHRILNRNNGPLSFPHVKLILVGGQSIGNRRLYSQTRQYFPNARIVQTYACTEAGSSITFENIDSDSNFVRNCDDSTTSGATCVGLPPPHIKIGIFGPNKRLLPNGKMGIIGTLGQHVMISYWNRGDTLIKTPNENTRHWMFTGDLGYIHPESNKLYFCGRANDIIRTGGESVLATEVERVIALHPNVIEVAVFALPHEKFGETVCAAVVCKTPASSHLIENNELKDELRRHCANHHLAGFKRPRIVFCIQSLPRNSSGKVLKQQLAKSCSLLLPLTSRL